MKLITDPRFFNFVIMAMYAFSAIRWGFNKSWSDMFYWLSALAITAVVTFGYKH